MACPRCNTWNTDNRTCIQVRCLACNEEQCHSRGTARGSCSVCHAGMLPGWAGSNNPDREGQYPRSMIRTDIRCTYSKCDEMAVYNNLPGRRSVACQTHGDKVIARREAAAVKREEAVKRRARRGW